MTDRLKQLAASLTEPQPTFKVGDLITWKDGLRNKRLDGEVVVTHVLAEPVLDTEGKPGSPYFREPLDIKVGHLDDDGDLIESHVDSRRFRLA